MAKHGHSSVKGVGRDHPASQPVPSSGEGGGRSPFGRDFPHTGKPPSGGGMPVDTGASGRDHPASKIPEEKKSNPLGTL